MATSGSYNFSLTAAQVIANAWTRGGILEPGGTIASAHQTYALQELNMLVKQWQARSDYSPGLPVWSRQRVTLFLAKGQQTYNVGPGSSDARAATRYGRTTIDAAEASGQTTISVTATTDTTTEPGTTITMTAADIIGVEQDDGTIFWSTISSVAAGDTVTIAAGLDVAAAVGNYVWWFTSRAQRFPYIESATLMDENRQNSEIMIYRDARDYDVGVADKYSDGQPTAILVEPLLTQTRVTCNSQPTDVTEQVVMTVLYPAEDYDAVGDDIAFPQEAYAALSWELLRRCAPAIGVEWTPIREANWKESVQLYRGINPEVSNLYFRPGGN